MKHIINLTPQTTPTALALGVFDGLHLGHRAVLSAAVSAARRCGLSPAVFTFSEHPQQVLHGAPVPALLTPATRDTLLTNLGIEQLFIPPFHAVMQLSPQAFVQTVLHDCCNAKHIFCGFNFRFGKGGAAGAQQLAQYAAQHDIETTIIPAITTPQGMPVSSTQIRTYLQNGQPQQAAQMLGRYFSYQNPVITGNQLGRTIGCPTANQMLSPELIVPRHGVYASLVTLPDGTQRHAVTNIGIRPTIGDSDLATSETWLAAFSGDLYGATITVELVSYLRPEQKFPSLTALRTQIEADKQQALQQLTHLHPPPKKS